MFGCRTAIGVACSTLALVLASGCGGAVEHGDGTPAAGASQGGQTVGRAGAAPGGTRNYGGGGTGGSTAGAVSAGGTIMDPDPVDTGCPPEDLPPPDNQCDPFGPNTCGVGAGCYPFVDHPQGSGCDQQHYGTICLPAGQGTQGTLCGDGADDFCAPGFVCVVGQRAGKRCAALCDLNKADQCTGGLICGDLDVAGYGVCG